MRHNGSIGLKTLTFSSNNLLANVLRHFYLTQELVSVTVISLNVDPSYMFITRKVINVPIDGNSCPKDEL